MFAKVPRRLLPFFLIILIFIFPMVCAKLAFHYYKTHPQQLKTTNQGVLVQPVLPVEALALKLDSKASDFHDKWTLLYVNDQFCDEVCQKNLYYLRQIHAATGKNRLKVQRLFASAKDDSIQSLLSHYRGTQHALMTSETSKALVEKFQSLAIEQSANVAFLLIVDPYGNVIMRYPGQFDASAVLHDLKRLLRAAAE